jgi:LPXTG-motif cell wall-anchored protein
MKALLIPLVLLALIVPALAQTPTPTSSTGYIRGAPGPLIGAGIAGLPVLLIGGGIYWIVRRKKVRPS